MSGIVYLNGEYLPLEQAKISVLDRGFLFGDGVYEVIPAYAGKPFRFQQHLQRLENSLSAIQINNPLNASAWQQVLEHLISVNEGDHFSIYLQITRGRQTQRDHIYPEDLEATVFIMLTAIADKPVGHYASGIKAITLDDIRWKACHIKATTLLANVMLKQQADQLGAAEAILIRDGLAYEGAASNLFIVANGVIKTAPKSEFLLGGITRDLVLELAEKNAMDFAEVDIAESELENADEIWLTSSTKEIMPVIALNDKTVGDGKAGPVWKKMTEYYQAYKTSLIQQSK
ncbi:MAG: D-amino acid aminotransferase [Gammaproteobacteria bacterium]|nr:D-amino acid aminotransferase [Gammaproteobacteria bacterium]